MKFDNRVRTISLPGSHDVNVTPIKPVVDHPLFQKLRMRKQMGTGNLIFPSATHTRFEHSLGTYSLTQERTNRWLRHGEITKEEADALCMFGLLHDLGHGPYSHEVEKLCRIDHNQNGIRLLGELHPAVDELCNVDFLWELMKHNNPLCAAVSHHPLGTDKLDYLVRDARHTNEAITIAMGAILNYSHFIDGQLVIDGKIADEVMAAQRAYFYMYKRVYFRKACLIAKRMMQKMVRAIMDDQVHNPVLTEGRLWGLVDSELDSFCISSKNPLVQAYFDRLLHRQLPKTAVVIRPEGYASHEMTCGKEVRVFPLPWDMMDCLNRLNVPDFASALETKIAQKSCLPPDSVFIVPVVSKRRFVPVDVPVYDRGRRVSTLRDMYPRHYDALQEQADDYAAIRVCVFKEHRDVLSRAGDNVVQTLLESVGI